MAKRRGTPSREGGSQEREPLTILCFSVCYQIQATHSQCRRAFLKCENLQSIILPEGLKSIGYSAFQGCKHLLRFNLPEGLISIAHSAFKDCEQLQRITIPEGVTSIEFCTFEDCNELQCVSLPQSLKSIDRSAFLGCKKVQYVFLPDSQRFLITSHTMPGLGFAMLLYRENSIGFLAYASKQSDNISDFGKPGSWKQYDLELINNGPKYKYKLPVRLLGALGRLQDPVELSDENRVLFAELLNKNAKKLVPISEALHCPDIIEALFNAGIMDKKPIMMCESCWLLMRRQRLMNQQSRM